MSATKAEWDREMASLEHERRRELEKDRPASPPADTRTAALSDEEREQRNALLYGGGPGSYWAVAENRTVEAEGCPTHEQAIRAVLRALRATDTITGDPSTEYVLVKRDDVDALMTKWNDLPDYSAVGYPNEREGGMAYAYAHCALDLLALVNRDDNAQ